MVVGFHSWGVSNPIDTVKLGYGDGENGDKWGKMGQFKNMQNCV